MKFKLKHKLLLLYLGASLCILIIIGGLVSSSLRATILKTISQNYHKQLEHIDFGLTSFFQNMEHDLAALDQNEWVQTKNDDNFTSFLNADEKTFQYNIEEQEQKIIALFNQFRITHPYVHSVYMGRENGSFVRSHKRAKPTRYDPRKRPWYTLGKDNPEKTMRTPPFRSVTTPDVSINFVKAMVDDEKNIFGVIGVSITLADLMARISDIEMDYNGFISLVDEYGTILVSRNKSSMFQSLESFDPQLNREIFKAQQGVAIFESGSEERYAFFYTSPALGWKLTVVVPVAEIDREIRSFVTKIILALCLALLLLSVLTLLGLQKFVIKPLTKLNSGTDQIKRTGDLDFQIENQSSDEIGYLAQSFNEMISTLKQSDTALKKSEKELRRHRDNLEELVDARTAELNNSQKQLAQIINFLPDPTWVVDCDGRVVTWNQAMEKLLGIKAADMVGKDNYEYALPFYGERRPVLIDLVRDWDAGYEKEYLSVKKEEDILISESYHPHLGKDGIYLSATAGLLYDAGGEIVGAIESLRDITDSKRMEEELVQAKQVADEANKAKSDFLANMSHEIRTPMNAVIGMTHLALKTDLNAKQQDYLAKIQSSANSLLGIINDILDFSKIEAGKLDMETVDFNLEDVLDNLANLVTVKAQEKEDLEVLFSTAQDVPRYLVGDPLRLGQVLLNLANNAVKFTDSGEIVVSTETVNQIDNRVVLKFSVSDSGIGLTPDQIARLFQAFTQADTSTTRKYGGTGLGLTISKRLVEMMGGEIWAESEAGNGSTFSFTAAFEKGLEKVKKEPALSPDLRNLNVLVVDDNATSRQILQDMLESFSFNVALAASGREGLVEIEKGLENKPFDLVLMDWKMPGMDGIEASRQIMIHPKLDKTPAIILVTAYGREEIMQKSDQLGLDGFLIKPVSPSVLLDNIMHALGEKKTAQTRPAGLHDQEAEWNRHFRGAQVLLAEDNEINQQVAKEILQNAGFMVDLADNGKQAVEALKNKSYDAVLMDIQMPVLDGYEATKKIRKWESGRRKSEVRMRNAETGKDSDLNSAFRIPNSEFNGIPIIAMTAHAMTGDREKSLEAGMNDHVTKPIDPQQLFATLQRWIRPAENRGRPSTGQDAMPPAAARETTAPISEPVTRTAADDDFPSQIRGFDLSAGMQRLQGNVRLYKKLLRDFAANYATTPAEIKTALASDDMNQAHHLVHSLKGVAANLAATDLQAAAIELENLVKPGKQKQPPSAELLNSTLTELEGVLKITLESIELLGPAAAAPIMEPSEDSFPALPPELARDASERIREAADMGDISQLKSIAEELSSKVNAFSPVAKKIIQLAEEFDFEGLVTLADSLVV
jgi:PAS domain S-box-containing protein